MPAHPGGSWWAAFGEQCWQWQGWRGSFWWGKFLLWWLCDLGTSRNRNTVQGLSLYSLSTNESGDQHGISFEAQSALTKLLFGLGSVPDACHEHGKLWVFHKYTHHSHHYHQLLPPSLSSVIITTTIISHYQHQYHQSLSPPLISHYHHYRHQSLSTSLSSVTISVQFHSVSKCSGKPIFYPISHKLHHHLRKRDAVSGYL